MKAPLAGTGRPKVFHETADFQLWVDKGAHVMLKDARSGSKGTRKKLKKKQKRFAKRPEAFKMAPRVALRV